MGSPLLDFELTETQQAIKKQIGELCKRFPPSYWRDKDRKKEYPEEFIRELTRAGWMACLIPEKYGGAGLGVLDASIILEEINRSGATATPFHAQMYTMAAILRHGTEEQKEKYLPKIAKGELRLQSFAVTEPSCGSDTTRITTFAKREGDHYVINGRKIFISRVQHSDLMLLLARTIPYDKVDKKTLGISLFLIDLRDSLGRTVKANPIETMLNHETNELVIEDLNVPAENLIGKEGMGFYHVLDGLNSERILVAAECIGDSYWFIERAVSYANSREVFGRPIGQNQGVQFPIADAYSKVKAADLVRYHAASKFDLGKECGEESNMAKLLASEALRQAADVTMTTYGGYSLATDMDVERKFRESRLYVVAPVTNNMVLSYIATHVLGMPRSF